ncbi:hypothetical protein GCM10009117_15660 [Gangjinia marincola]|uniref:Uncharacterized protein n=1 Tax=Gangjinia marincola TaxID=578463 RepID=A0ABP3XSP1_9FLAO
MFVGHYAAAFALKGKQPKASLGLLFIAVQFVDILFFPFAVLGIEKLVFVEDFTAVNDFVMTFPYTHGLLGSLIWGVIFGVGYILLNKSKTQRKSVALVLGLAVLSHWFTDLIVHTPDLPLVEGEPKFGLGLWQNKHYTFLVEAVLLLLGVAYYFKNVRLGTTLRKLSAVVFVVFLLAINYLNLFVLPANNDLIALTISALVAYFLFSGLAYWLDGRTKT